MSRKSRRLFEEIGFSCVELLEPDILETAALAVVRVTTFKIMRQNSAFVCVIYTDDNKKIRN